MEKNVFTGYGNNILIQPNRTFTEISFEEWCENYDPVKYIDKYATRKFEALKAYGSKHPELKWGFVRAVGTQIYLSNTEWSEDMTNRNVWKPIEVFINDVSYSNQNVRYDTVKEQETEYMKVA